jgi:hypothetical protein
MIILSLLSFVSSTLRGNKRITTHNASVARVASDSVHPSGFFLLALCGLILDPRFHSFLQQV